MSSHERRTVKREKILTGVAVGFVVLSAMGVGGLGAMTADSWQEASSDRALCHTYAIECQAAESERNAGDVELGLTVDAVLILSMSGVGSVLAYRKVAQFNDLNREYFELLEQEEGIDDSEWSDDN